MSHCIDASVVLKWFLVDEPLSQEAGRLLAEIMEQPERYTISEWILPEVIRGLIKSGWSVRDIDKAYGTILDLARLNGLVMVPVSDVLMDLKDLQVKYNLYGSDAVHLATALDRGCEVFWTEDRHFRKQKLVEDMKQRGLRIDTVKNY